MELHAPSRWQCIDFLSDLHLQASEAATVTAWQHYLRDTVADAVFLLGDIFEVWVGDDTLTQPGSFEARCADTLRLAAQRLDLHILHGNRDFLMGPALAAAAHMTLLDDPTVLVFAGERWVLTHGDALCLDDSDYQQFRAKVRSPDWQRDFLAKPLAERNGIAHDLRAQSEARKRSAQVYADVDAGAALDLLQAHDARHMVHGHTHRPATHRLDDAHERLVLSDWDLGATLARADLLRLRRPPPGAHTAFTLERIPPAMAGRSGGV